MNSKKGFDATVAFPVIFLCFLGITQANDIFTLNMSINSVIVWSVAISLIGLTILSKVLFGKFFF